jgi:hypothetical protein
MSTTLIENTYWNSNGLLQNVLNKIQGLDDGSHIPDGLPAKQKLARAFGLYHDLYNNGGCNYGKEIRTFYGMSAAAIKALNRYGVARIERKMDALILAAYHEDQLVSLRKELDDELAALGDELAAELNEVRN